MKKSKIHVRKPVSSEGTSIFAETSSPATNPNEGEVSNQPFLLLHGNLMYLVWTLT